MEPRRQTDALEAALGRLGVRIVEEELPDEAHVDGGLCTVDGQRVLYLAPTVPPWRRLRILLDALQRLPHEGLWLPPEVRRLVGDEDFGSSEGGW